MSHRLVGKRIEFELESQDGPRCRHVALLKPGRHEGEVFLVPEDPDGPRGFLAVGLLYVHRELAPAPVGATDSAPADEPPPVPALEDESAQVTDARRLSETPISSETRRRRGRGGPVDHGSAAAGPDEYQPKGLALE
jgi:hypothetical protein